VHYVGDNIIMMMGQAAATASRITVDFGGHITGFQFFL